MKSICVGRQKTNRRLPAGLSTLIKSPGVTGHVSTVTPERPPMERRCHGASAGWAELRQITPPEAGDHPGNPVLGEYPCSGSGQKLLKSAVTRKHKQQTRGWANSPEFYN